MLQIDDIMNSRIAASFQICGQNDPHPDLWGSFRIFEGHVKITNCNNSTATEFLLVFFFIITDNCSQIIRNEHIWNKWVDIHGSHIFGLTNFPDFSSSFFPFSSIFFIILFNKFNKHKIYLTNTLQLNSQIENKNKDWLKCHHFSSIWGKMSLIFPVFWVKFPDFSSLVKIPRLFPDWKKFSYFSGFFQSVWEPWILVDLNVHFHVPSGIPCIFVGYLMIFMHVWNADER